MARVFFVLSLFCGVLGFGLGLYPVQATVDPSTFSVEAWILAAEVESPMAYQCGSALSRIDYLDRPAVAEANMVEHLAGPRLMAGCDQALRPWTLASVLFLAGSSLFTMLMVVAIGVWMTIGTLRLFGRAVGFNQPSPQPRHPVPVGWS